MNYRKIILSVVFLATFSVLLFMVGSYVGAKTVTFSSAKSQKYVISFRNPVVQPVIISLEPNSGSIGTKVTIKGNGFTANGNKIKFGNLGSENNLSYNLSSNDGQTIVFTVPRSNYFPCWSYRSACKVPARMTQPGNYSVSVINAHGTSNSVIFRVTK